MAQLAVARRKPIQPADSLRTMARRDNAPRDAGPTGTAGRARDTMCHGMHLKAQGATLQRPAAAAGRGPDWDLFLWVVQRSCNCCVASENSPCWASIWRFSAKHTIIVGSCRIVHGIMDQLDSPLRPVLVPN